MSLILDALRKSEAERRRGQSPGLFTGLPAAATPRRDIGLLQLLPWGLFALLLAAVAWVLWPDAAGDAGAPALPVQATEAVSVAAPPPTPAPAPVLAPEPVAPVASTPVEPRPGRPVAPAARALTAAPPVAPAPTPAIPITPAPAPSPRLPASAPPPAVASVAPADAEPLAPVPPIAILGADERATLPPLKLSMHVFASEPEKRFAIIDGQRVGVGSVAGAAVVEEIRRDGVVLVVGGRRVLLPRP